MTAPTAHRGINRKIAAENTTSASAESGKTKRQSISRTSKGPRAQSLTQSLKGGVILIVRKASVASAPRRSSSP